MKMLKMDYKNFNDIRENEYQILRDHYGQGLNIRKEILKMDKSEFVYMNVRAKQYQTPKAQS